MGLRTISELLTFNDWAREKLVAAAAPLADAQLDRKFDMGEGSVRATLAHLWFAEQIWLDRWLGGERPQFAKADPAISVADLHERFRRTADERAAFLAPKSDRDLDAPVTFTNMRKETYTFPLRDLLLHVCNHGSHHRAQAVNMLRHVGAQLPKPGIDYIFMKIEQQATGEAQPADALDVRTVRACFAYADWARARVHHATESLADEALDQPFEMGIGTLRKTLVHIRDAEQWWLDNWTSAEGTEFPAPDVSLSIQELSRRFDETADARNKLLETMSDTGLTRVVRAVPRPGIVREFPIGVTMLQLCHHGTHHRAQALNMLRHVGGTVPGLDVARMLSESR